MANSARARSTCAAGALSERLRRVNSLRSSAVSGRRGSVWWRDMGHLGARGSPHHYTTSHGRRPTSPLSGMKCWVEASEFDAGILGCELPFDLRSGGIAPLRPAGDLALEGVLMGDAARQALARKDAQLDLRLVQPGAVLGRVVDLEPVR